MKRVLLLFLAAIVAVLAINACEKLPDGTGTLKVEVSGFYLKIMSVYIHMDLMIMRNRSARKWQWKENIKPSPLFLTQEIMLYIASEVK